MSAVFFEFKGRDTFRLRPITGLLFLAPPMKSARRASLGSPAFSLIELLTVVAVVGILFGITLGLVQGVKRRETTARARAELTHLAQALEDYKRHYGDYPQTGLAAHATPAVSAVIGSTPAEALFFNALTGVFGPSRFSAADRLNGPCFVDLSRLTPEVAIAPATFGVPTGNPPRKTLVSNSFLDPWGRRYQYYYRPAAPVNANGVASGTNPWQASSYVLYSVGPDGLEATTPNRTTGLYTGTAQTTGTNADNIYADKIQ
jgi:prepilin-type N-terminal cleavage/methylation domain-containing protein